MSSNLSTDFTALSVNVNKVAWVRNTRHLGIPSVVRAATLCLEAGAHGITVHPRPDERHIRHHDVTDLASLMRQWPDREYNIEGNPLHNLMDVARDVVAMGAKVHQLTFVPDAVGQFTSDHGWQFPQDADTLRPLIAESHRLGARVSLFMDADATQMAAARAVGADRVELYTEPYAAAHAQWLAAGEPDRAQTWAGVQAQLHRFAQAAQAAVAVGLQVNAGHDLNLDNLALFLQHVPQTVEVSIGHALLGGALEMGYGAAVAAYLARIEAGHGR